MRWIWTLGAGFVGLLALTAFTRADDDVPADKALLVVKLPDKATLTVDGSATQQTGPERWYLSPPLVPGKTYTYELAIAWTEDGKPHTKTQSVKVSAGKRTVVDFVADVGLPGGMAKSRTFLFTYAAVIKEVPKDKVARIWLPLPTSTKEQDVALESKELPGKPEVGVDKTYGNEMFYVEGKADAKGVIPLKLVFRVTRREVLSGKDGYKQPVIGENLTRFLQPDALVPLGGKSLGLIKDVKLPDDTRETAKVFYDVINNHMRYNKDGTGWGRGDADWTCDSKFGNCTDFHSVFIALSRAQKIPAKFEMGFSIPEQIGEGKIGGYHCWAWFLPQGAGKGWLPVDISEANRHPNLKTYYFGNLTADRVQFTTGRDIDLAPQQAGKALNYFIYPYVEVDGQPLPAERIERTFSYRDVAK